MAPSDSQEEHLEAKLDWSLVEKLPVWTAALAGLVLATGFVVELTFLDRFGLRETGVEFFKAKYLHVGLLHLLFSWLVAVPCYAIVHVYRRTRAHAIKVAYEVDGTTNLPPFELNLPMALLAVNLLLLTYVFVVLVPPRLVSEKKWLLAAISVFSVVSPWLALWITKSRGAKGQHRRALRARILMACCVPVLAADIAVVWGSTFGTIKECLYYGGYLFFAFSVLLIVIAHRLIVWTYRMPDGTTRVAWWTAGICVLAAVYYLSAVSFAYRVYPFIPADKGGGDYTEATSVTVRLHEGAAVPSWILEPPRPSRTAFSPRDTALSKPLIIIEETADCVYLADPNDAGGPFGWRRGFIPTIIQVNRSDIASVVYLSRRQL